MAVCTATEVFDFMNSGDEVRASNAAMITALIERVVYGIEQQIGRSLSAIQQTIKIHDGRFCSINDDLCFLNGVYYDIVSISELIDNGVELTENTSFVIEKPNKLERINSNWGNEKLGLEITGAFGLVYPVVTDGVTSYVTNPELKQITIEAVAAKSGLWGRIVEDGEGRAFQVVRQTLPAMTIERLKAYVQPVL